jgi:hypothetical protein
MRGHIEPTRCPVGDASDRRKDYMVSKRVHALYMLTWITSLLLVGAFGVLAWQLVQLRTQVPPDGSVANGLVIVGALAFVIVAAALTLGVYTIVHTHRMVGSAYHVATYLERLNSGQASEPLKLRDEDYFKEIADHINAMRSKGPAAPAAPEAPKS